MTFVSAEYAILLAAVVVLFHTVAPGARMPLLTGASYVFYAWWNPWHAVLILASTLVHFTAGRILETRGEGWIRRLALGGAIAASLGLLGYFKYANFGLDVLRQATASSPGALPSALSIVLPAGISFYTFQCIAYTVDVYRGKIPAERSFSTFALFVSFFPQLMAGPIERASDLLPQLRRAAAWKAEEFEEGIRLLIWGLVKKTVVADRLVAVAGPMLRDPAGNAAPDLFLASLALFTFVYFDFSAYTDMARGSARLFGIRLSENFRWPMTATNPADGWRRWHMTLTSWVRDYVFVPLGGMRPKGWPHTAAVTLLTMGLLGLWHGASWNFVAWGVFHGVVLLGYFLFHQAFKSRLRRLRGPAAVGVSLGGWAFTMACHAVAMVWFFSPDMAAALRIFRRYGDVLDWGRVLHPATPGLAVVLALLWLVHAWGREREPLESIERLAPWCRAAIYLALILAAVFLAAGERPAFIYFQF